MSEYRPATVEEAVDLLIELGMKHGPKDLEWIKNMPEHDLISLHFSFGMWIRNTFGLWSDNKALLEDTKTDHPDSASTVIIKALWKKLNADKSS